MSHQIERELQMSRPVDSPARELILNLYRTERHLTAALEAVLAKAELHLDEFNVLRILRGAGEGGHPRGEIERRMIHDPNRLLAILHKLKARGLVEGLLHLAITPAGRELLAGVDPAFEATIEDAFRGIEPERVRTAIEVLEQVRGGAAP